MDAKMRATLRGQVKGCSLKHNSHEHKGDEKNITYYSSLTNSRTKNPTSKQMIEDELAFYEKYFDGRLKMSNQKYIENCHKERCQTLKQFYDKHQPEELILQIGDKNKHLNVNQLIDVAVQYYSELCKWSAEHNDAFTIMGFTIHMDEATPHIHLRRLWHSKDSNGNYEPGYNPALRKLGYERPDTSKKENRNNNPKMTFDAEMRKLWYDVIENAGYEIEREPRPYRKHLSTPEYKEMMKRLEGDIQTAFDTAFTNEFEIINLKNAEADEKLEEVNQKLAEIDEKLAQVNKKDKQVDDMLAEEDRYKSILRGVLADLKNIAPMVREMAKNGNTGALNLYNDKGIKGKAIRVSVKNDFDYEKWIESTVDEMYAEQLQTDENELD